MISAVIRAEGDVEALAFTLAALVPAVAEGVLRDAVIVDGGSDPQVRDLAEAAGTAYATWRDGGASRGSAWLAGADAARGPWFLLLTAGDVPGPNWIPAADRFIRSAGSDGSALFDSETGGIWRLAKGLMSGAKRRRYLASGMIVPRSAIEQGYAAASRMQRLPVGLQRHTA
ncbi:MULTISPECIES: hypothetical protein [unclassified Chelatococcus]|uniref:hypothetical protein n=1 Tax=unclassified Chelatococcus TaxID=2638111 RepID=UPI001BD0A8CC|nr:MULTISPECIES: hypothetical protein [unclassified Chelatococcus]MBS7698276.1 hypothetical protein [Chelatococcus sp. YT9]MBX3559134.1 hypothetical protein [Chelatococcus sp.]